MACTGAMYQLALRLQPMNPLIILTAPDIPHNRKRFGPQTRRPAPQIRLRTARPQRRHQHRSVAVPLVTAQRGPAREQRACRTRGPERARGAGAALREGARAREGGGEVAGARVGDWDGLVRGCVGEGGWRVTYMCLSPRR
jgi:hypothetical protein